MTERVPFGKGAIHRFKAIMRVSVTDKDQILDAVKLLRLHHHATFAELILALDGAAMLIREYDYAEMALAKQHCAYLGCGRLATHFDPDLKPRAWYCDKHAAVDDTEIPWADELHGMDEIHRSERGEE